MGVVLLPVIPVNVKFWQDQMSAAIFIMRRNLGNTDYFRTFEIGKKAIKKYKISRNIYW